MNQLICLIEYQFTEINCTETKIAFAQGQVVFQLEPGETYFLAPLYNGIAVTWPSTSFAHLIRKKSNRENKKKRTFLPIIHLISDTPMLCHEMVKSINYLGFMFHSCIRGILFCL